MAYQLSQLTTAGVLRRDEQTQGHTLIVLVHGWHLDNSQWRPLLELADKDPEFEGCDFYLFTFPGGVRLRTGIEALGGVLANALDIHTRIDGAPYRRVILIGYSIGGLIVRSAFLTGLGIRGGGAQGWAGCVTRIILMATPNRGIGGPGTTLIPRAVVGLTRLFGGRFLRDAMKGSDFITSLRLDWVYAFRDPDTPTPEVVQLLGIDDEYVRPEDSTDVTSFKDAKLFMIASAKHADMADFADPRDDRYLRLRMSCFKPIADVYGDEPKVKQPPSAVLFTLHGIRDYGGWLGKFAETARQIDPGVRVVGPGYGWFSLLGFVTPWVRRRRIAWFCDRYTEEIASCASLDANVPFHFIGHSYGTYLLAQCLKRFPRMQFERVCLVGSVVPDTFEWRQIIGRGQIRGLRNDCASFDWPVAICCRILNQVGFRDLGTGGFVGFQVGDAAAIDNLHIRGNHSATLTDESIRRGAAKYLLHDDRSAPPTVPAPGWFVVLSRWALPLVLITALALGTTADGVVHEMGMNSHVGIAGIIITVLLFLIYL